MDFTGERFVPEVEGDIKLEHVHRYMAVRQMVRGKRVLDIACGEGYGSKILAAEAISVIGVDLDDASVQHAAATYTDTKIRFLRGDIVAIPLGDSSVDVVVSFETLEHLTDHQSMMREIRRVLSPGGVLVVSSPDKREYSDLPNYKNPYHMRELYLSEFRALLNEHFAQHELYGQRVHYASFLAPAEPRPVPFIGYREDETGGVVEGSGLPNAVYLLAVASDGPLPDLSAGLFIPIRPPYHRDISFLSTELEMHQRLVAMGEQREAGLKNELKQRADRLLAVESKLAVANNDAVTFRRQLEEERRVRHESGVLYMNEINARGARMEELGAEVEGLRAHMEAMYHSASWKLSWPVRIAGRAARKLRRILARLLRGALAPVPVEAKVKIRHALFSRTGKLFARSGAYRRWHAETAPPPPPVYAMMDTAQSWTAESLAPADGVWEWAGHRPIRARIANVLAERRAALTYKPRPAISVADEDPRAAAARITLPPPGPAPDVTVIVPVFNELATTIECLLSIAAAADPETSFEVIVANDASTDDTAYILADVPHLTLLNQPQNLGFLRNCNSAAKQARGRFLVFLNNDAQVSPNWLTGLAAALAAPGAGAAGPRIVYPNGVLQEAGNRIRRDGTVEMIGLTDVPENPRWSYPRDVDYVSGACLMIHRALFEELGGFADDLAPAYCEDLDLSLRIRAKGLRILYTPDVEILHHLSKSSDGLGSSYKLSLIARNTQRLAERHQAMFDALDDVRVIAFYLPQFHPMPENDLWWGAGFTEWNNVAKALPNFVGHDQPRIPADLGFYDLRLAEVMEAQWKLAASYGIDGFCYYYYWFDGHRLLDRPLKRLLDPKRPAHPFCLCWANENWTRRWDGKDDDILMAQNHSPEDDLAVLNDIAKYMRNPAYIRIRDKYMVLVYRTDLFPDFAATAGRWREEARRIGLGELYIVMIDSFRFAGASVNPADYGCDASMEFPAHYLPDTKIPEGALLNADFRGEVGSYEDSVVRFATREHPGFKRFRTVMPGWDNTPRRQDNAFILENPTPGVFQAWLEIAIAETKRDFQGEERLVFINAWNEWGEGAYLEPDRRFGHAFLQAVKNARDAEFLLDEGS
jgi:GT2 family glycosyltransferase/2-polyprenyl-3-methyl-5-hydroxy-6-metoxy-1,4-benzoquinol methylase